MTEPIIEKKLTDAELLKGGPGGEHGKEMPKDGETHPELKSKEEPKKEEVTYELNGKTFSSAAEMSKYVADLEKKIVDSTPNTHVTQNTTTPGKELIDGRPIEDMLFENPTKVLNHFRQSVKTEIDQARQQEENKKTFWSKFYTDNPDLNGKQDLVDAYVSKNWGAWNTLPLEEFAKVAAKTSRESLKKMGLDKAIEVPNNKTAALNSSGTETKTAGEVVDTPKTFTDELMNARRKRITKAK